MVSKDLRAAALHPIARLTAPDPRQILRSFLPPGGSLLRVSVYPSDFGLERMREEEVHGPRVAFGEPAAEGDRRASLCSRRPFPR